MSVLTRICEEANEYECCEDAITDICCDTKMVGELLVELLEHNNERANCGNRFAMANADKLVSLMANMMRDYLDETV